MPMPKDTNITISLHPWETKHLAEAEKDAGGFRAFQAELEGATTTATDRATLVLDDRMLGALLRHMSYGGREGGGYQGRLRKAFSRSIRQMIGE